MTPTDITLIPATTAILSHASVVTTPAHVTAGTKNGYDSNSSDGVLDIIDMGSSPTATVNMSSLRGTIQNALYRAQESLQEEVSVAVSLNTVSAIV